ncbi:MAG TPA: ABC transporter permease [Kofleriaceae bacterium]|jgi:ABC-2 type transport system permease protein|nr:ABC transporter permease [Kofleriaceae bacterium]
MSDLRDTCVIARREFLERVQSKWFAAITLLGPIGMVAMVLIPALIAGRGAEGAKVEIVDKSGAIGQLLLDKLAQARWKPVMVAADTPDPIEMGRIRDNKINGFVTIPADALDGGKILYRGDNASSQVVQVTLHQIVGQAVQAERGKRAGISKDKLDAVLAPPSFEAQHTNGETQGASGMASFLIAYLLAFILYMVITLYGVGVMRSVVQEKTSRVMELMVATVKPRSLMAGKILGVGAAGLVQITVWLAMGAITLAYRDQILGAFGATGAGPALPSIAFGEVAIVIVYFILGFFFYASMYAAVGAMVSSEQDTQQVQMPVTMLLVVGVLCLQMVSNDPRGSTTAIMTMVPFWSSMLMPMRYVLGGATLGEVAISLLVLVVSTIVIARLAAKIYRVGVLMYGKRPSVQELIRWLRY